MIASQQKRLEENIYALVKSKVFDGKNIYVFGSNEPAERIIDELEKYDLKIVSMLDNNEKKKVFSYHGAGVAQPSEILVPKDGNALILIASKYFHEMSLQLEGMGYEKSQIHQVVKMETGSVFSLDENTWEQETGKIKIGVECLKGLRSLYGEDVHVFILPWQAIGDIYMGCRYLRAYIKKIESEQGKPLNYIITVMGNVRKKVAMTCGYEKIHVLSGEESQCLCRAVIFLGYDESRAEILQHRFAYTNRLWKLGNYKGINFDDHFRYSIFGLSEDVEPVVSLGTGIVDIGGLGGEGFDRDKLFVLKEKSQKYMKENNLVEGKTVILSPYANTISNPSREFWISVVEEFKKRGYTVVTNSGGDSEPAIEGTNPVLIPFDITVPVVELCGMFMGLRSGLCDLVASAKARKIIIYPDRIYVNGSVIDFYSLNKMGLCDDAFEYVYNEGEPERTLGEIMDGLG